MFVWPLQPRTRGAWWTRTARWSREDTATAACSTPAPERSTSTEATRPSVPTSTAWLETCTSSTWTRGNGEVPWLQQMQLIFRHPQFLFWRQQLHNNHICVSVQDHPQRQRLLPLPPHGRDRERDDAGVRRKHAQRHVHEPRRQVLLLRLPGVQSWSVHTHTLTHTQIRSNSSCSLLSQPHSVCLAKRASSFLFLDGAALHSDSQQTLTWELLRTTAVFCCWTLSCSAGATEGQMSQLDVHKR